MSVSEVIRSSRRFARFGTFVLALVFAAAILWQPRMAWRTFAFVASSMAHVAPIVVPGVLLAAWMTASGASAWVSLLFQGRTIPAVLTAAIVGALLPVCGVTVLPLMAGLLAAGVPLAPVMAFWLSSPITGPEMLAVTVATLGWQFATGKALAAIGLGLFGGFTTAAFARHQWVRSPLRSNRVVGMLGSSCEPCSATSEMFNGRIWKEPSRRARFVRECWSITRLMLIVLTPAFAAEFLLNAWLRPDALSAFVGHDSTFAIPLAVFVGGPAYIDGYAALPLTRALIEHGMSPGAAMAFLVSGGVVSIWGAMAIFPVLKPKPFLLYLGLAVAGSMASGWIFGMMY